MYKFLEKIKQAMPLGGFWISVLIFSAITSFIYIQENDKDDLWFAWYHYDEELVLRKEVGEDIFAICKDGTFFYDYKSYADEGCASSKHGGVYYYKDISDEELSRTPDQRLHLNNIILLIFYFIGILVLIGLAPNLHNLFFLRN
tara:strand:- start:8296 stop:8727 length:432 start_codon:yes stop_codon:yes gene_type:complete